MTQATDYCHVYPATMNPCTLTAGARATALASWLCPECGTPRPGITAVDAQITESPEARSPLNFVQGTSVPLAKWSFLEQFGVERIRRSLYIGKVFGPNEQQIDEWVTYRGRIYVIIRGTKNVSHRMCSECKRDIYFAMGEQHLFPQPSTDVEIFESDHHGLVFLSSLVEKPNFNSYRGLTVEVLPVAQGSRDGLGVLNARER